MTNKGGLLHKYHIPQSGCNTSVVAARLEYIGLYTYACLQPLLYITMCKGNVSRAMPQTIPQDS